MKNQLLLLVLLLSSTIGFSQNLDSLYSVAKQTKNDSIKLRKYNKVGFSYIFNDTKKAKAILNEGIGLAKQKKLHFSLTELTNTYGIYMAVNGNSDSASFYFENALKMSRTFDFESLESKCINNLGMFNWNTGNFNKALDYFFQSLKMCEDLNDEESTSIPLNNIGLIYQEMSLNEKALTYHNKALKVRETYNLENDQIASLNNIGINLKQLGRIDEAIAVYKKGIELAKRKNNLIEYYRLLDNLANAYNINENLDLALKTYLKSLERPEGFEADQQALLSLYNNIATLYNQLGNPKIALNYTKKGFELVKKHPAIELRAADLHLTNAESQYMLNDFVSARQSKLQFVKLNDSIFSEANAKAIADLEIQYETEKKEKEILVQRAELAEQQLTLQQRSYQIYGLVGLVFVLGLLGFLFYNQQKLKNQQLQKENELKDALIKIETQNRLQEQRLRISRDLHDNIGAQLTFIISSIDNLKYGFDIKNKKLTNKLETISEFTTSTIYELRDTIWAMNKTEISLEDLQSRISNFIDKANITLDGVNFNFITDSSEIGDHKFTSVEGMNIYRIIQEGINNALKYSHAKHITVGFSAENGTLNFEIADDGKGFNLKTVELGNGIANMKKRAQDIGAHVNMSSEEKKGTTILLQINKT